MVCMYHAWLTTIRPLVSPLHTWAVILHSLLVLATYLRTWRTDPGTLRASR